MKKFEARKLISQFSSVIARMREEAATEAAEAEAAELAARTVAEFEAQVRLCPYPAPSARLTHRHTHT